MEAAMRLYERSGFERTPERDVRANDFFGAGAGETLEALAFVLELKAPSNGDRSNWLRTMLSRAS
jgi:hypothetical protein